MPMTLGQAMTAVRSRLGEPTAIAWSDVDLRGWINEGVRDVARRTESLQTTDAYILPADTREFVIPATNLLRVYSAYWADSGNAQMNPLEYRDFNAMDSIWANQQQITSGTPNTYTLWGFPPALKLLLYPTPVQAGTLTLHYYIAPAALATDGTADATQLQVVEAYTDLVIEYATYLALRRDRDQRWQEARVAYEDNLQMMQDQTRRWTDQAGTFTSAGNALPNWLVDPGW